MRDIKFRAWDKYDHKMIYGQEDIAYYDEHTKEKHKSYNSETYLAIAFDGELQECCYTTYYPNICDFKNWRDRFELMQYTERKDKNGVEIYEGDILKHTSTNPFSRGEVYIKKVMWGSCGWHIEDTYCSLSEWLQEKCEVIGNIHEATPEQLKEWGLE